MNTTYDDEPGAATEPSPEEYAADLVRITKFLDKHAPETAAAPKPRSNSRPRKRRRRPRPRRAPMSPEALSLAAHEARCAICNHANRDAIEEEFVHWHRPHSIAVDYRVERRAIYRHAHALNLFAIRDRNIRWALGHIIESAEQVDKNADSVIRAVRAFTRVNTEGQWVEPPAHVIVSSGRRLAEPPSEHPQFEVIEQPALPPSDPENPAANLCAPLDTPGRTEFDTND